MSASREGHAAEIAGVVGVAKQLEAKGITLVVVVAERRLAKDLEIGTRLVLEAAPRGESSIKSDEPEVVTLERETNASSKWLLESALVFGVAVGRKDSVAHIFETGVRDEGVDKSVFGDTEFAARFDIETQGETIVVRDRLLILKAEVEDEAADGGVTLAARVHEIGRVVAGEVEGDDASVAAVEEVEVETRAELRFSVVGAADDVEAMTPEELADAAEAFVDGADLAAWVDGRDVDSLIVDIRERHDADGCLPPFGQREGDREVSEIAVGIEEAVVGIAERGHLDAESHIKNERLLLDCGVGGRVEGVDHIGGSSGVGDAAEGGDGGVIIR